MNGVSLSPNVGHDRAQPGADEEAGGPNPDQASEQLAGAIRDRGW